jgi:hypothetical protein
MVNWATAAPLTSSCLMRCSSHMSVFLQGSRIRVRLLSSVQPLGDRSWRTRMWRTRMWRTRMWRTRMWRTRMWRTRMWRTRMWRTRMWRTLGCFPGVGPAQKMHKNVQGKKAKNAHKKTHNMKNRHTQKNHYKTHTKMQKMNTNIAKNTQQMQNKVLKRIFSSTTLVYMNVFQRTAARCTQTAYTHMRTRILEPRVFMFIYVCMLCVCVHICEN